MQANTQRFRIRWSWVTWVVTAAVIVIVVFVTIAILGSAMHTGSRSSLLRLLVFVEAGVPVVIFGVVGLFAPLGYEVSADAVVVRRLVRSVIIPMETICDVRRVEPEEIRFAVRLFASGGFLGWFGLFFSQSLRRFWAYAGNRDDLVLVTQTDGTRIVLSPDPPDGFIETVWPTEGGQGP